MDEFFTEDQGQHTKITVTKAPDGIELNPANIVTEGLKSVNTGGIRIQASETTGKVEVSMRAETRQSIVSALTEAGFEIETD